MQNYPINDGDKKLARKSQFQKDCCDYLKSYISGGHPVNGEARAKDDRIMTPASERNPVHTKRPMPSHC